MKLGQKTKYEWKNKPQPELLETFENKHPNNLYVISLECFEVTSLCPVTKQPDMATIYINYIPTKLCIESKSLKLYLFSYRQVGSFMEDITNTIMKELIKLLDPMYIEVYSNFNSRGGIYLRPFSNYYRKDCNHNEVNNLLERYYAIRRQN